MYAYFKGVLEEKYEDGVVIEVNGIGYNILMPNGSAAILPPVGQEARIYTYTSVREDAINLFGFTRREDLNIFKMLITVSGIGPKGALSILSQLSAADIRSAILAGDSKTLSSAPGIGKKTAEKAIIELRDRIQKEELYYAEEFIIQGDTAVFQGTAENEDIADAIAALGSLGISPSQARSAVTKAAAAGFTGADELLKQALKFIN